MKLVGNTVTAAIGEPSGKPRAIVVLAHGAGGDLNDKLLLSVSSELVDRKLTVVRFNFPYRDAGRAAPGAQKASEDCYRSVADEVRKNGVRLFLGGKSYGGRMASHIVSDGYEADGLIFLSYPLHAPGKPDRLRDEHLHRIKAPMLFCQGTKDPFATPSLLDGVVASLKKAKLHRIDGGDHSLNVRGRTRDDVTSDLVETIDGFVG